METKTSPKILRNKTILIVEDDQFISRVYVKWLRNSGAEVIVADNGAYGLEVLKKQKVDLALLDLGMPGMNGYEMVIELKKDSRTKDIPVIIISNSTIDEGADGFQELIDAGVTDILRKYETSLQELVESINRNLSDMPDQLST